MPDSVTATDSSNYFCAVKSVFCSFADERHQCRTTACLFQFGTIVCPCCGARLTPDA